jgi:hypothetical protein
MPCEGVTVSEQRQNFIRDYADGYYSRTELANVSESRAKPPISGSSASRRRAEGPGGAQSAAAQLPLADGQADS